MTLFLPRKFRSILLTPILFFSNTSYLKPALAVEPAELQSLKLPQAAMAKAAETQKTLSVTGRDIAEQIGVVTLIDEIIDIKSQLQDNPALALKHLEMKQKLLQQVLIATLTVRDTTARIDHEIAELNRQSGVLSSKRDKAVQTNSMANVFGTGALNEIGQAGEMKNNEIPGEITELVAGGIIMALGGLSLYQQSGSKIPIHQKPNMLAEVLNCPTDRETLYPGMVWTYLNRPPAGSKSIKTRLDLLVEQWQKYGTVGPLKNPRSRRRLDALSNTAPRGRLTLGLLGDQMDMLSDVKAEVYQMDRDLLELLINVQSL